MPSTDGRKGDQYQLKLTYHGRTYTPQGYTEGSSQIDLNWQRELTKKIALVLSAIDLGATNKTTTVVDLPDLKFHLRQKTYGRYFRLGLSYLFATR